MHRSCLWLVNHAGVSASRVRADEIEQRSSRKGGGFAEDVFAVAPLSMSIARQSQCCEM
jgi:hypothetical protein